MKKIVLCLINILCLITGCAKTKDSVINLSGSENILSTVSTKGSQEIIYNTETIYKLKESEAKTKSERYNQAIHYIEEKRYPQAIGVLADLDDYKDAKNLLEQLHYIIEGSYIGNGIWAVGAITYDGRVQVVGVQ